MDLAVLTCLDPLVDLAGIAALAGTTPDEVAAWAATDRRFPEPVGDLPGGPVFGYGTVCDYVDLRAGRPPSDARERGDLAGDRYDETVSLMLRMSRTERAPRLVGRSAATFIVPRWEPVDPRRVLRGGPVGGGRL
jgi:hypothetical protein